MPKPCSKPLQSNPFETYRDPVTGRWEVRHPASDQLDLRDDIVPTPLLKHSEIEYLKRFSLAGSFPPPRRRWKSKPRTKVVA